MTTAIRPAGLLERYHITRHFLGLDSCVICAAQYSCAAGTSLDKATLFPALRQVVKKHASLSMRLSEESTSPTFIRLQTINLSELIEFSETIHLDQAMEAQFLQPFDTLTDRPLWHVVVLKDNTLIFAWHHCIGEGLSGLVFHRDLLAALQEYRDASTDPDSIDNPIYISELMSLPPAIEDITALSPSWGQILQELYNILIPKSWTRGATAWTGNIVKRESTIKNRVKLMIFSSDEVEQLVTMCRSNNATVTSALHTLAITVLSNIIVAKDGPPFKSISSLIPISLRGIAGASPDIFCDYVSAYHSFPPISTSFSWSSASQLASTLRSQPSQSREKLGMLKYLSGRYDTYFQGKLGGKRDGGLEVSNLGVFNTTKTDAADVWLIEHVAFVQCDCVLGPAIKLNIVTSSTGNLTIGVTWGEDAVDDLLITSFINDFQKGFTNLIQEGKYTAL